jgi:hypothetical protein
MANIHIYDEQGNRLWNGMLFYQKKHFYLINILCVCKNNCGFGRLKKIFFKWGILKIFLRQCLDFSFSTHKQCILNPSCTTALL